MTSSNTLLKKIIGVKDVVVTDAEIYSDHDGVTHLTIDARPNSWNRNKCPFCGRKKLPGYDRPSQSLRVWRGLDLGGVMVDIRSQTNRIVCPEHGVVTADVPWAYPNSGFTKDFDMTVSWLAKYLPRSTDADKAETELNHWLWWVSHSRIPVFHDLYKKIKRHKEHILVLVTYDVNTETKEGKKRLRHVAKICTGYGIRVQNSVFECNVDASQLKLLRSELLDEIDKDNDSIRFYNLGNNYHNKVEHYGTKVTNDLEDTLIF